MEFSTTYAEVVGALARALPNLSDVPARQEATIPSQGGRGYSYRYADLGDVYAVARPILAAEGLVAIAVPVHLPEAPGDVAASTMFLHTSGEWMRTDPFRLPRGATPQTAGSAYTYARRYSLLGALGLATEDDDAVLASQAQQAQANTQQSTERTFRTPEEAQIHGILAAQPAHVAAAIRERFRNEFSGNLSALDPSRHAEALAFVIGCTLNAPPPEPPANVDNQTAVR